MEHKAADIGLADVVASRVVTSEALGTPVIDNGLASQLQLDSRVLEWNGTF